MKDNTTVLHLTVFDSDKKESGIWEILLVDGESIILTCKGDGYQVVFTDKRIILVTMKRETAQREEIKVLPYSRIQSFSILTDSISANEGQDISSIIVRFTDSCEIKFEFLKSAYIKPLVKRMSESIL